MTSLILAKFLTEFGGKKGVIAFTIITMIIIMIYYMKKSKKKKLHKEEDVSMFKARITGYAVALSVPITLGIAVVTKTVIKMLVNRPRPNAFPEIMVETGKSFPSGHSIGIATMVTILIYFVIISDMNRVLKYILVTLLVLKLERLRFLRAKSSRNILFMSVTFLVSKLERSRVVRL